MRKGTERVAITARAPPRLIPTKVSLHGAKEPHIEGSGGTAPGQGGLRRMRT